MKKFRTSYVINLTVRKCDREQNTEETPSSYFLLREKRNAAKSTISELSVYGKVIQETSSIVEACRQFYSELYSAEAVDAVNSCGSFMLRAEVRGSTQTCSRPNHNNNARVIKIVSYVQYERL